MDFEEMRGAYLRANGVRDDIVIRLRNMTILNDSEIDMTIYEAADEIERLRKQLADKQ